MELAENLLKQILTARVYDVAQRTPLDEAMNLSGAFDNSILLKREDLQPAFSCKIRGSYNKITHLSPAERKKGVICASAGNHAQGVALSAQKLSIPATVVMPVTTPQIKVKAVEQLGAEVILAGDSYLEAEAHCRELLAQTDRTFIHPFDDPLVIAGQGAVAREILEQCPDVDLVFCPIGGGGLIAGVAGFIKALRPEAKIIGVQPEDSSAMAQSLAAGERVALKEIGLFADGVAVKQVGVLMFQLVGAFVDEIVKVSTDQICSAIKRIYEDTRSIMEPAGALAVAGLKKYLPERGVKGKKLVAINSGANMNFDRQQFVAERTLTGEQREALFSVTIPEKPGSLRFFCENVVGDHSITEFNYRLSGRAAAHIYVGVSISHGGERRGFQKLMTDLGFENIDLTDNDLAKTLIRHMVGGKSPELRGEVLYRFEFPERPQALANFLGAMSESWNISLFHYRMNGGIFGRVLVGFEIPKGDEDKFEAFLDKLHYGYAEETGNPAYRMFL